MKIFIDLNHPAHVHYFRNFIRIMKQKGHEFCITARNKEVTQTLLNNYKIDFIDRGAGRNNIIEKLLYMIKADFTILKIAKKFKPDIFLSFGSMYLSHVAFIQRKPNIILDDTEHAHFQQLLTNPFSTVILTPSSFLKNFGKKQIRFNSYMEYASLHPNVFKPDSSILNLLRITPDEKYIILRFISWNASHDFGYKGISYKDKLKLVEMLSKTHKVFISSEGSLPESIKKYRLTVPPDKLHDVLAFASLYVGEGGTTATECSLLGVPTVLINPIAKKTGNHIELRDKYKIQYFFDTFDEALPTINNILTDLAIRKQFTIGRDKILQEKTDLSAFLIWFITEYPWSVQKMKENPDIQKQFIKALPYE